MGEEEHSFASMSVESIRTDTTVHDLVAEESMPSSEGKTVVTEKPNLFESKEETCGSKNEERATKATPKNGLNSWLVFCLVANWVVLELCANVFIRGSNCTTKIMAPSLGDDAVLYKIVSENTAPLKNVDITTSNNPCSVGAALTVLEERLAKLGILIPYSNMKLTDENIARARISCFQPLIALAVAQAMSAEKLQTDEVWKESRSLLPGDVIRSYRSGTASSMSMGATWVLRIRTGWRLKNIRKAGKPSWWSRRTVRNRPTKFAFNYWREICLNSVPR